MIIRSYTMDSEMVVMKLETICSVDYAKTASINKLYVDIIDVYKFIHDNVSNELYMSLHTELGCLYNEIRLGDGDYGDMVFNDCIKVLKQVIEELK